ncbi:MAG: hypothetical protein D6681_22565, partial [Calditrichaeota bacterium]
MQVLKSIPLFGVLWIIYNLIVVAFSSPEAPLMSTPIPGKGYELPSGTLWHPTYGDLMLMLGLVVLYVEILKSTRSGNLTVVDHTLSTFVFIGYLLEFLNAQPFGESTFLLLGMMSMVDV